MSENTWLLWSIPLIIIGLLLVQSFECVHLFLFKIFALIIAALFLLRWYIIRPMYHGKARIDGKTVLITGANTGIGKETAMDLAKRGGKIVILCRNVEKGKRVAEEIRRATTASVQVFPLDLSDLSSVRECAKNIKERFPKIDILINNAGVMMAPEMKTKDGFELQFGTNHLGHFLFTLLVLENVKAAAPSRIINVSSLAHENGKMHWEDLNMRKNYSPVKAYGQSKLANILFTKSLAEKLKGTGVTSYALHPGVVATELARHVRDSYGSLAHYAMQFLHAYFSKTPLQGAQTTIYCAVDQSLSEETGLYYSGCKKKKPTPRARSKEDAERLWKVSLEMVGLDKNYKI